MHENLKTQKHEMHSKRTRQAMVHCITPDQMLNLSNAQSDEVFYGEVIKATHRIGKLNNCILTDIPETRSRV